MGCTRSIEEPVDAVKTLVHSSGQSVRPAGMLTGQRHLPTVEDCLPSHTVEDTAQFPKTYWNENGDCKKVEY